MTKILSTVGFEIEGVWKHRSVYRFRRENGGSVTEDGSINCEDDDEGREYRSKVFKIEDLKGIRSLFSSLSKLYRTKYFEFNRSCGFHVHTGYGNKVPTALLTEEFYEYFEHALRHTFPRVVRSRGRSNYCKLSKYEALEEHERNNAINFLCALRYHGTIEFRIYPADCPRNMYRYTKFTIDTIRKYLKGRECELVPLYAYPNL